MNAGISELRHRRKRFQWMALLTANAVFMAAFEFVFSESHYFLRAAAHLSFAVLYVLAFAVRKPPTSLITGKSNPAQGYVVAVFNAVVSVLVVVRALI